MAQVVEGKGKLMDNLSNYIIVDIGANLTNKKFSRDLDQVIQRATDSGEEDQKSTSSNILTSQGYHQINSAQAPYITNQQFRGVKDNGDRDIFTLHKGGATSHKALP